MKGCGGSEATGGKFTEEIADKILREVKFATFGRGGGGANMFSLTEWIVGGAVWLVLVLFACLGYRMEQRSYGWVSVGL